MSVDHLRHCLACGAMLRTVRAEVVGRAGLARCGACRSEFLSPPPTDDRLSEIYGPDYYVPWDIDGDSTLERMKQKTFARFLDVAHVVRPARILDVGCATGFLLRLAADRGFTPYGIDLNEYAILECKEAVPEAFLHCGSLSDEPFPGVEFDAIFAIDFIEHVRDPVDELRTAAARLAPGGRLVLSTPRVDSLTRRLLRWRWPQYREEHLVYLSLAGATAALRAAGLEIETTRATYKTVTLGYAHRQLRAYPQRFITGATTAIWRLAPFARDVPISVALGEMTIVAARAQARRAL